MYRFDIVVPCYNYGHYLRQCVQSLLTQEDVAVRVLILDDASQDESESIGRQLSAEDSRVEFRRHAVNQGHIKTYNEGLQWARGDFCLLLSADDALTPGALGRAARVFATYPSVGLVFGRDVHFRSDAEIPTFDPALQSEKVDVLSGLDYIKAAARIAHNLVPTPTAILRTSLQHRIGGYRPHLPATGDMEMWLRCAVYGPVARLHADQAYYRVHGNNMHIRQFGKAIAFLQQRKAAFDELFAEYGHLVPYIDRIYRTALEVIAAEAVGEAYCAFTHGDIESSNKLCAFGVSSSSHVRKSQLYFRLKLLQLIGPKVASVIWRVLKRGPHRLSS